MEPLRLLPGMSLMHKRARCADSFVFWLSTWKERFKLHVMAKQNTHSGFFPPLATVEYKHRNLNYHGHAQLLGVHGLVIKHLLSSKILIYPRYP